MARKRITICKSEKCISCYFLDSAEAVIVDGEEQTEVRCSLELNKGAIVADDESIQCPEYRSEDKRRNMTEEEEKAVDKTGYDKDKVIEETRKIYAFRGESLVEVLKPSAGQKVWSLYPSFVEFYNLRVAGEKQTIQKEIERLQGGLVQTLQLLKSKVEETGEDVTDDDILLILEPGESDDNDSDELDAEMVDEEVGDDEVEDVDEDDEEWDDEDFEADDDEDEDD
jgi:hypothetical protein